MLTGFYITVWSAEEKYELVAQVLAGESCKELAISQGINYALLYQWVKPSTLAPLIGIIGVILYMGKNEKRKGIGTIMLGFMALMTGMDIIRVMILDMPTTLCQVNEGQEWIIEMINAILIEVLASMAEQERIRTLNRQAEGILAAQLQGKHLGRPKMKIPEGWGEIYMLWKSGEITAVEAMKRSGLKKSTFYKLAKLTDENYPW